MILLNYLVLLGAVALAMVCSARSSITEKVIFESKLDFKLFLK